MARQPSGQVVSDRVGRAPPRGSQPPSGDVLTLMGSPDRASVTMRAVRIVTHPAAVLSVARYVNALPRVSCDVSDSQAGQQIRAVIGARGKARLSIGRFARPVVQVPDSSGTFLRGSRRQALRTNLRRGHELGLEVVRVGGTEEFEAHVRNVLSRRQESNAALEIRGLPAFEGIQRYVVLDRYAIARAYMIALLDDQCALLVRSMSDRDPTFSALPHYLLHARLMQDLTASAVPLLVGDMPYLRLSAGERYLQERLGYEPVNLIMRRSPSAEVSTHPGAAAPHRRSWP